MFMTPRNILEILRNLPSLLESNNEWNRECYNLDILLALLYRILDTDEKEHKSFWFVMLKVHSRRLLQQEHFRQVERTENLEDFRKHFFNLYVAIKESK